VEVVKYSYWTNHPECVRSTDTFTVIDQETGGKLRWLRVEFSLGPHMKHVAKSRPIRPGKFSRRRERRDDQELPRLVRKLRRLIEQAKQAGVDTTEAERLERLSRQAFREGDLQKCKQLLRKAIETLQE
jgi:hypothetical protein